MIGSKPSFILDQKNADFTKEFERMQLSNILALPNPMRDGDCIGIHIIFFNLQEISWGPKVSQSCFVLGYVWAICNFSKRLSDFAVWIAFLAF